VDTLMTLGPEVVETEKLLPALLRCDSQKYKDRVKDDPVIKYLEFALKRSKTVASTAVHNLLLARYAQQDDESALEAYIRRPDSNFGNDFGLQLCLKKGHRRSAVLIYAKMGMYEESVASALRYGAEYEDNTMRLAKEIARKPNDLEKEKMLMKQIVEYLVDHKKIDLAMDTVQKCADELLSIEDIIKDLPDEMQIGEIAKDLCHSLDQSKKKVEELRKKMQSTKDTTKKIKEDIKNLLTHEIIIPDDATCELTKLHLKGNRTKKFYHYVDGSSFFAEALYPHVRETPLPPEVAAEVEQLESEIHQKKSTHGE